MGYIVTQAGGMALTELGAMVKKRLMLRYFGGSTEIVVCADEKTVYWGAADELQGMTRG